FRPVILIGEFSLALPLRYSITSTELLRPLTSSKPALAPSVGPSPRSTTKFNCVYGRSRSIAMSCSGLARLGCNEAERSWRAPVGEDRGDHRTASRVAGRSTPEFTRKRNRPQPD